MALNDIGIKALRPKSKSYILSDGEGLYLEINPGGTKAWRYRYHLNGKQEKVSLGVYPYLGLKAARRKHRELQALVAEGQSPAKLKAAEKQAQKRSVTVQAFVDRHYRDGVVADRRDPDAVLRFINRDILPSIGNLNLHEVTTADIRAIVFTKKDDGAPSSALKVRGILKKMFDVAVARGLAERNPVNDIPARFVATSKSRERALSAEELRLFLTELYRSDVRRQYKLALHQIVLTLVRKNELVTARWDHINFDAATWEIPQTKTKPHIVFLARQAVELLQELRVIAGTSEWVCPGKNPSKSLSHNVLNVALGTVQSSLNIEAFTIHDLRRTASTLLHESGFVSDVIEKALNHTIQGVKGIYNRAEYADQRREMLQFWADYVADIVTERKVIIGQFRKSAG